MEPSSRESTTCPFRMMALVAMMSGVFIQRQKGEGWRIQDFDRYDGFRHGEEVNSWQYSVGRAARGAEFSSERASWQYFVGSCPGSAIQGADEALNHGREVSAFVHPPFCGFRRQETGFLSDDGLRSEFAGRATGVVEEFYFIGERRSLHSFGDI